MSTETSRVDRLRAAMSQRSGLSIEEIQQQWHERVAAKLPSLEREHRYRDALMLVGRNDAPTLFRRWFEAGALRREELRELLPEVWELCEYPRDHGVRWWLRAFKEAGPLGDTPSEAITIYRGAVPPARRGMAWTRSLELARWFASRPQLDGGGRIYEATTKADALLFVGVNGRGEDEVVVNPYKIRDVVELRDGAVGGRLGGHVVRNEVERGA